MLRGSPPEIVHGAPSIADTGDRDAIFAGDVLVGPPNAASLALVAHLRGIVEAAFPGLDPRDARDAMSNEAWFRAWAGPRQAGGLSEAVRALAEGVIASIDGSRAHVAYDVPRLRAVTSDGHRIPEAAPAYRFHRDTWYGNPNAQINL